MRSPSSTLPEQGGSAALALLDRLGPALRHHNRAAIADIVRQITALRPALGEQWRAVAQIAAANGEFSCARAAMAAFVADAGDAPTARYEQAGLLAHMNDWAAARVVLDTLPENALDPLALAHSRGTAAMYLGDIPAAREQLGLALRLHPQSGATWLSLATLIDFAREPEMAYQLLGLEPHMSDTPALDATAFAYAMGKALADLGEHARAFAAFARGARIARAGATYDRTRDRGMAEEAVSGYDAAAIARIAAQQTKPTARTIFVTGLPRSGTTLVEQILASHSAVAGGGELNLLPLIAKEIGGIAQPTLAAYVSANGAAPLADLWHHWLDERFPAPGRVVDKTTNSSRMMGLAASVLPDAPLIWLTRDPLDRAWSCLRTFFKDAQPWSYDQTDIAHHFRLEDRLLAEWQDMLGERLLVVSYEGLASDPAAWTRRILAHCGLAEEPGVFTPNETRRQVNTSSVMQVREPISRKAIGAAQPYREWLAPFMDAYSR